ncbi:MAG: KaiC 1 [Marmoricola sp.]|nr:KaiC 1 [Marmoricola sp.]
MNEDERPERGEARRNASGLAGPLKAPTGITGFDEVTGGGVPRGRPTLVAGTAGSGKTLFGLEFLVRGIVEHGEPGVLLAFEESEDDLATNVASLGFDLPRLVEEGKLFIDCFRLDPADFLETGSFDLDGLFIRLASAVEAVGAKRVVLDTVEILLGALPDSSVVRSELGRLFRWLKDRGLTVVITGERGGGDELTRFGIEEYVSDCVVALDHRVRNGISTRRLRVVKYRGSVHGTNEYPFLVTADGIVVVPITSLGLTHEASHERVSTGVPALDEMLGGGVFRGSSVMVSGSAGTGKTSIAASMAHAACERGERVVFLSFEESPSQLARNMASIGLDLEGWSDRGLLVVHSVRPTAFGLEEHLAQVQRLVEQHDPSLVVLDAMASLGHVGSRDDTSSVVSRDLDLLKGRGITAVMTTLMHRQEEEVSQVDVSSLVDTWILLRNHESNGERNRLLFVIKSRGTAHSNQVREFVLSDTGPELVPVFLGPDGVLTGSSRAAQEAQERRDRQVEEAARRRRELEHRTRRAETEIESMRRVLQAERAELDQLLEAERSAHEQAGGRAEQARLRQGRGTRGVTP